MEVNPSSAAPATLYDESATADWYMGRYFAFFVFPQEFDGGGTGLVVLFGFCHLFNGFQNYRVALISRTGYLLDGI